jgi:hypothetical protein
VAYDYITTPGYGDTFYQHAYNAGVLTNGSSYSLLKVDVVNYDFICRHWAGWETVIDTPANSGSVQCYDDLQRQWCKSPMAFGSFPQGQVVLPEKRYRVNSKIQFDLATVLKANNGGTNASQLVWTGVRRMPGANSDPAPSPFNFKRTSFAYPFTLTVQQAPVAPVKYTIPITDYDFELERVELTPYSSPSKFAIQLYDMNNLARSNVHIDALRFFHSDPAQSNGELSFWPAPPLVYRVNSAINFEITSRIGAGGPLTFQLLFVGSWRIPCN